ncbi:MAG: hypothetical protein AAB566_01960, partial [Patescibacteria group bacterium]
MRKSRKSPHNPGGLANSAFILVTSGGVTPRRACEIVCRRFEAKPLKLFVEQTRNELEKLLGIIEDPSDNFGLKNALEKAE